jgi:hypothetical protein
MKLVDKSFRRLFLSGGLAAAITVLSAGARAQQTTAPAGENDVTAIDILLDPDATMIDHAKAANARLLKNFPKGYTLGGTHQPHVSMLQRYVRTADLDKVYAAADKVFAKENPTSWKLKAVKYEFIPDKDIALVLMVAEPTPDLLRLQQELIDAVTPYTVPIGTKAAYVTTPQAPNISDALSHYVAVFVPEHSGDHYVPHVTVGVGTLDFAKAMRAEDFDSFTFSPVGASVYHLGEYGTAMKKLHSIPLKK